MNVLSICRDLCPEKLSYKLGERLGYGVDGEVFEIIDDPSKVIKLCIAYPSQNDVNNYSCKIAPALDLLINNPIDIFARVYVHKYLGSFPDEYYVQDFILYYYIMEKLQDISEDEKKVFHTILSHEDRGIVKNFTTKELLGILHDLNRGLDFDIVKVLLFYHSLKECPITHQDIHPRNIMKDKMGNFKMVDFDKLNGEYI